MAGVEGAGEMAGFAVAFEAPTGERACHGQNVFKVVMRVQPLPNDSGPDLELTMVIGEREYVADGLYFVDMRSLGPAPTTHNVNVTVVPIFAHCQHTGAAYDHALEMSGCAKSTAPPVAATIMPWGGKRPPFRARCRGVGGRRSPTKVGCGSPRRAATRSWAARRSAAPVNHLLRSRFSTRRTWTKSLYRRGVVTSSSTWTR